MSQDLHQTTCTTCRTRECCSHFSVELTGADLFRIARTLRVAPAQFSEAIAIANANPRFGFSLQQGGPLLHLALKKQFSRSKLKPCVFLLSLDGDRKLCGLGELRPEQCQLFPVLQAGGSGVVVPKLYKGPGCWRTWHLGELNIEAETSRLTAHQQARAEYAGHVAAWNQHVGRQHSAYVATFAQFAAFIMNRYAEQNPPPGA